MKGLFVDMEEMFGEFIGNIIIFLLVTNVIIPILIGWLIIKYIFHLRQKQNEQFLVDLGYVVRNAVSDALADRDDAQKRVKKTSWSTYNSTKSKPD